MSEIKPQDIWRQYEVVAKNFDELLGYIHQISEAAENSGRQLAWRGQEDYSWAFTSKLYRDFLASNPHRATEESFAGLEREILKELRRWGLHSQRLGGRLSILAQLAMLQHLGSPTRMLDITFNALVAAFFATEKEEFGEIDGRICIVDITDRVINEISALRDWEDSLDTPWSDSFIAGEFISNREKFEHEDYEIGLEYFKKRWKAEWTTQYFVWRPPSLDARIAAQSGGFLFGGLIGTRAATGYLDRRSGPSKASTFQLADPRSAAESGSLSIADARIFTCFAIRPQPFRAEALRKNTKSALYSIRISSSAKTEIRNKLKAIYGFQHASIYPDYAGFATYGVPPLIRKA